MRFDDRVDYSDIRARMLPTILVSQNGEVVEKPLKHVRTFSAATQRWREKAGCPSWYDEPEGEALNNYVKSILPADCFAKNSTRDFRNLTQEEIDALRGIATGSGPIETRKRHASEAHEKHRKPSKKHKGTASVAKATDSGSMTERPNTKQQSQLAATTVDSKANQSSTDPADQRDSRDIRPFWPHEFEELRKALLPTLAQLNSVLGFDAPTFKHKCYADQVENLQSFVKETLLVFHGDNDPPTLIHLTKWTGGITNVNVFSIRSPQSPCLSSLDTCHFSNPSFE